MDTAMRRPIGLRRVPLPMAAVVLLLILAAVAAALFVGAQPRVPAPFGPADNGQVIYASNGDLYVSDGLDSNGHLLVGGPLIQSAASWSPDGRLFTYVTTTATGDEFMVANADGSNTHRLASIPPTGNAQAAWRPDSRAVALIYDVNGHPELSIAFVDGSPTRKIDLGGYVPSAVAWRPPDGAELLIRMMYFGGAIDLATVRADGTGLHRLNLPHELVLGSEWDNTGGSWSPDGSLIAYNRVVRNPTGEVSGTFRVHVIKPDGSGDVALPAPDDLDINEAWPAFSPDGRSVLVHRWTWNAENGTQGEGWLAVMPADGSAPAHDIGPKVKGGQDTGMVKLWSPDGTRVLVRAENRRAVYSIDPVTGLYEPIDWTTDLPDWQRTIH